MKILNKPVHFILYVKNQDNSKLFYEKLLGLKPVLDVSGMTEFQLSENSILGLMPAKGIAKILTPVLPHPETGKGIPRCEIYLFVDSAEKYFTHALQSGAFPISTPALRSWGVVVAYVADPDGHVLAFAEGE